MRLLLILLNYTGLVTLTCCQTVNDAGTDLHEAAFQNFRLLQGFGAALAFSASLLFPSCYTLPSSTSCDILLTSSAT
jgi:hypothetical protein